MDPNAALFELRRLCELALDGQWAAGDMDAIACELAEKIQGLDNWLSKGGFLPTEWNQNHPATKIRQAINREGDNHVRSDRDVPPARPEEGSRGTHGTGSR